MTHDEKLKVVAKLAGWTEFADGHVQGRPVLRGKDPTGSRREVGGYFHTVDQLMDFCDSLGWYAKVETIQSRYPKDPRFVAAVHKLPRSDKTDVYGSHGDVAFDTLLDVVALAAAAQEAAGDPRRPFDPKVLVQAISLAEGYRITLKPDAEVGFFGSSPEMPGVMADGQSPADCVIAVRTALGMAIATMIEQGQQPPKIGDAKESANFEPDLVVTGSVQPLKMSDLGKQKDADDVRLEEIVAAIRKGAIAASCQGDMLWLIDQVKQYKQKAAHWDRFQAETA